MSLLRYWHTLRHLRLVQVYGRLWFRLYRPRPARPDRGSLAARNPGWAALSPDPSKAPEQQSPFPLLRPVSMLGPARFRFLSQTHDAIGPEAWNDAARDKFFGRSGREAGTVWSFGPGSRNPVQGQQPRSRHQSSAGYR
jgi:hypothetical protein